MESRAIKLDTLTPDTILNRIEHHTQTALTPLITQRNSYINRVYEVECQDTQDRWIAKFYRPGRWSEAMILQEHHLLERLLAEELPVIAPLKFKDTTLFDTDTFPFAVFPKKWGRALDELSPSQWEQVGRLLGRIHAHCHPLKTSERLTWTPALATQDHAAALLTIVPTDFQKPFKEAVETFINTSQPLFNAHDFFLIHGDCHLGNIISRAEEGLYLVDFDDCVIGPAIQDLWMLLPAPPTICKQEINWFAQGYDTFAEFPDPQLKLIPALSIMRQIHFAAWCALQSQEPHFQHHFPNWGTPTYWKQLLSDIRLGQG